MVGGRGNNEDFGDYFTFEIFMHLLHLLIGQSLSIKQILFNHKFVLQHC